MFLLTIAMLVMTPANLPSSQNACVAALGPRTLNSATCPQVFGTSAEREANAAQRKLQRVSVSRGYASVDITYSEGQLAPPQSISLAGVELLRTASYAGCEPAALVRMTQDLAARSGCVAGTYAAHTDDKIGIKNAIVAIFDGGLLLSREQALRVLVPKETEPPFFRMIWQSKWRIPENPTSTVAASPTPHPNNGWHR